MRGFSSNQVDLGIRSAYPSRNLLGHRFGSIPPWDTPAEALTVQKRSSSIRKEEGAFHEPILHRVLGCRGVFVSCPSRLGASACFRKPKRAVRLDDTGSPPH